MLETFVNSRSGRLVLRALRRTAAFCAGLLGKVLRDSEMSPEAGKGVHATKGGSLYVDIEDILKSPGSIEAARRGDSVLSAEYRPLHSGTGNLGRSWTVLCTHRNAHEHALAIELPAGLVEFLSVQDGDTLIVDSKGSNAVVLRKSSARRG